MCWEDRLKSSRTRKVTLVSRHVSKYTPAAFSSNIWYEGLYDHPRVAGKCPLHIYSIFWFWGGQIQLMLRNYSWFCTQESFLVMLGGLYVVLGLNLGWPYVRQTLYLPSYRSSPRHCLDVDISPKDGNPRLTFESAWPLLFHTCSTACGC